MIGVIIAMRELVNQLKSVGKIYSKSVVDIKAIRQKADDATFFGFSKALKDVNALLSITAMRFNKLNQTLTTTGTKVAATAPSAGTAVASTVKQKWIDAQKKGLSYSQFLDEEMKAIGKKSVGKHRWKDLGDLLGYPISSRQYDVLKSLPVGQKPTPFSWPNWAAPTKAKGKTRQAIGNLATDFFSGMENMGTSMLYDPKKFMRNVIGAGFRADRGILGLGKKLFKWTEGKVLAYHASAVDPNRMVPDTVAGVKTQVPLSDFLSRRPKQAAFFNKLAAAPDKPLNTLSSWLSPKGGYITKPFRWVRETWGGLKQLGPPLGNMLKSVGKFASAGAGVALAMAALQILSVLNPFRDIFEVMMDNFSAWGDIFNASMAPLMIAIEQLFDSPEFMAIVFQLGNLFSVLAVAMVPLVQPLGMIIKFAVQLVAMLVPIIVALMPVLVLLLQALMVPLQVITNIFKIFMPLILVFAGIIGAIAQIFVWFLPLITPILMMLSQAIAWVMTKIMGFIVSVWNWIAGGINNLLDKIGADPSKRVPLLPTGFMDMNMSMPPTASVTPVSFTTPMAAGGIVTRPTFALIGEAGPEAVVPLSRGGVGENFTININSSESALVNELEMSLWRRNIRKRSGIFA